MSAKQDMTWMEYGDLSPEEQWQVDQRIATRDLRHRPDSREYAVVAGEIFERKKVIAEPPKKAEKKSAKAPKASKNAKAAAAPETEEISHQAGDLVNRNDLVRGASCEEDRLIRVSLSDLCECPLNPRKRYDEAKLRELGESVEKQGVIHALLVRPRSPEASADGGCLYEVIAGHRRFRAALLVNVHTLPVVVRPMSDAHALSLMLSENLQRQDLNAIEEAEGYASMLALVDPVTAVPVHTLASLALEIGKSIDHVRDCLRLLRLPDKAREAVETGVIGKSIGYMIAKVPDKQLRKKFADEVIKGWNGYPMSFRETNDHRRRNYMVELTKVPFDRKKAALVPQKNNEAGERISGGACADCPWNSANGEEPSAKGNVSACLNPACYAEKVDVNVRVVKEKALEEGKIIIEGDKAKRVFEWDGKTPRYDSGMVRLDETVDGCPGTKKPPTWKKMLSTAGPSGVAVTPQIQVVIDDKGKAHELVQRSLAIAAATKNGFEDMLRGQPSGKGRGPQDAARLAEEAKKKAEDKLDRAVGAAALGEMVDAIERLGVSDERWYAFLPIALHHCGSDGVAFVAARRGIEVKKDAHGYADKYRAVKRYAEEKISHGGRMGAFLMELLLAGHVRWSGAEGDSFAPVAKAYGIDVKAIRARVTEETGGKKGKKAAPILEEESTPIPKRVEVDLVDPVSAVSVEVEKTSFYAPGILWRRDYGGCGPEVSGEFKLPGILEFTLGLKSDEGFDFVQITYGWAETGGGVRSWYTACVAEVALENVVLSVNNSVDTDGVSSDTLIRAVIEEAEVCLKWLIESGVRQDYCDAMSGHIETLLAKEREESDV